MNITEQFAQLLQQERKDDLLSLLQTVTTEQKKELLPGLKRLEKEYTQWGPISEGSSTYRSKGSSEQLQMLSIAAFVCYNRKDFEKNYNGSILNKETLDQILPWYCPSWFGDHMNHYASERFVPQFIRYDWYMELVEQNYVTVSSDLIAKILPQSIFEPLQRGYDYVPDILFKRPITLQEHIWYLFAYDTSIHWSDRYISQPEGSKDSYWIQTFQSLAADGGIDRQRLLKETLLAANRGFNQNLSGWFISLFSELTPTPEELLALQGELIGLFNSPHSKPINAALQYCKTLTQSDEFDVNSYLAHASLILTSESKSVVTAGLVILEKLAKIHVNKREEICLTTSQTFIHQDNGLQLRAAKLIHKYADHRSAILKEALAEYSDVLLSEVRVLLNGLVPEEQVNEETDEAAHEISSDLIAISYPQSLDDLVFLASQAFDQNESYHFDLLPAALLKFQSAITSADVLKLMPAFQRAYKITTSDWTSTKGFLDDMLAEFFISWGQLLTLSTTLNTSAISTMHDSFLQKEKEKKEKWSSYGIRLSGIKAWHTGVRYYKIHKHILLNAFFMLERKIVLPLLSTPTHEPCWVSIETLAERLAQYQTANIIPGDMDFQVAIARTLINDEGRALLGANNKLTGEYRNLMGFILREEYMPPENSKIKMAWFMASIVHRRNKLNNWTTNLTQLSEHYLKADFQWATLVEPYMRRDYNYEQRKYVETPAEHKVLRIQFGDKQRKQPIIKTLLQKLIPQQVNSDASMFDDMELNFKYNTAEHNDIKRLLYLNPHQPDLLLAQIINKSLVYSQFWEEADKKLVTKALDALLTINHPHAHISHLFIATCMLSSDKTVRTYAAELWVKGVTEATIQSAQIGEIIAKHEQVEFAPLKRFTDLLQSHMFQISAIHNQALQLLLTAYLEHAPDVPVNNTKKLLEVLIEVLNLNKSEISNSTALTKLYKWKNVDALKMPVKKLTILKPV
jgi:hypothetical protein